MAAGFLVKGILIGLIFGIPVGAVGALTVQRAYQHGFGAGLKTGMGSSFADCLYAACGAFGLTFISDFLLKYQMPISIAGGCFVLIMGVRLFLKKEETKVSTNRADDIRNTKIKRRKRSFSLLCTVGKCGHVL